MKKFTAKTLQEALLNASQEFQCSVVDLEYEIVQNPSTGFLGFGKKDAIIVATTKASLQSSQDKSISQEKPHSLIDQETKQEIKQEIKEAYDKLDLYTQTQDQDSLQSFTESKAKQTYECNEIWGVENDFAYKDLGNDFYTPKQTNPRVFKPYNSRENLLSQEEVLDNIRTELKELLLCLPFDLECVEVSLRNDNLLFIKIDGKDCPLLIGEKGYRYKALLYLLVNWINPKYGFTLRLEVAQFLSNQEQLIDSYLQSIIKLVQETSKAQTKPFDGVLAYIALGKLREVFPRKYVSFRTNKNGEKYIIIDDFKRF